MKNSTCFDLARAHFNPRTFLLKYLMSDQKNLVISRSGHTIHLLNLHPKPFRTQKSISKGNRDFCPCTEIQLFVTQTRKGYLTSGRILRETELHVCVTHVLTLLFPCSVFYRFFISKSLTDCQTLISHEAMIFWYIHGKFTVHFRLSLTRLHSFCFCHN